MRCGVEAACRFHAHNINPRLSEEREATQKHKYFMKMKSTQTLSMLALALTLGSASAVAGNAVNNAPAAVTMADEVATGNDEATVQEIQARLDNFEKNLNDAKAIAAALNATANYQATFDNLTTALATMKAQFASDIEAGLVVEGYELEGLSAAEGQISTLMGPLNGMFSSTINSILNSSFPVNGQISSTIAQLSSKLEGWGLAEQFAEQLAAVQTKAQEASANLTAYVAQVSAETDYVKKLQLAKDAQQYIFSMRDEILAECSEIEAEAQAVYEAKVAANKAAYDRLTADFAAFQALYQTVSSEFQAIAAYYQSIGSAWPQAQTYGGQLGGMQSGMMGINATLQQAYAAGTLTEETTLASLYPQFADMEGSLNQMKSTFEQTIGGLVQRSIMPDLSAKMQTTIPSAIGEVERQVQAVGMTEQYADRLAALNEKKTEASTKFNEYLAAISAAFSNSNYAEAMTQAIAASTYVNGVVKEVTDECDAIKAEIQEAYEAKSAANQAAYDRLMAKIAELEEYYSAVYAKFMQVAPTQPSGWAMTYGNQLGGIQGAIQGMKGTVGAAYGRMELDENYTIGNYDSILAQLQSIEAVIDSLLTTGISSPVTARQFANGEVYDLNGRRVMKPAKGLFVVGGKKVMVK